MKHEYVKFKGELNIKHYDADMQLVEERDEKNLVVTAGLQYIISRMKDATLGAMGFIGVGTSATAASAGQTALVAMVGSKVATDTAPTIVTKTVANDTLQFVTTFGPGVGTGALNEAGIFNATDVMLCRTVFASGVVNKGAGDTLVITWKVTAAP